MPGNRGDGAGHLCRERDGNATPTGVNCRLATADARIKLKRLDSSHGLIALESGISWFAVRQLGRYFTVVVAVRPDQPVIQSGLYRFLRHPSYSG